MNDLDLSSPKAFGISIAFAALAWLGGKAIAFVFGRSDKIDADRMGTIERWAQKAAATILPLVGSLPTSLTDYIEGLLKDEIKAVMGRVGIQLTDAELAHAVEVAHEEILRLNFEALGTVAVKSGADIKAQLDLLK